MSAVREAIEMQVHSKKLVLASMRDECGRLADRSTTARAAFDQMEQRLYGILAELDELTTWLRDNPS